MLMIASGMDILNAGHIPGPLLIFAAIQVSSPSLLKLSMTFRPTFGGAPGDITGGVPSDTTIICEPLPLAPVVRAIDPAQPAVIVYSESVTPGDIPGVYIVTRTWTATDACGNTSTAVQHITWIPDTFLECEIILPEVVDCNAHGEVISSGVTGGITNNV